MRHATSRSRGRIAVPLAAAVWLACAAVLLQAQPAVHYRFSFPEPEHRWMQVDVTFTGLSRDPLELCMSRSSPGRYAVHDFAKNVYDVEAQDGDGRALPVHRTDPHGWSVSGHAGRVRVRYKVYGDRLDGTYLAIDPTHAHINMPAALMWARGLDDHPIQLALEPPAGRDWQAATQLLPGRGPLEFTAPNLQYLMDSPVEFGPGTMRTFRHGDHTFRLLLHHRGTESAVDALAADVQRIVGEQVAIFGEFPAYEPGHYTFIIDDLPWANGDAMEHRNSTVITSTGGTASRLRLLESASHEFFHGWNVERIRPRSLEPFDFERANMSGELWLAEGFTEYYGPLTLVRAGLADLTYLTGAISQMVTAALNPARAVRSPVEMSHMAVFTDGGRTVDRTNWPISVISYYPHGAAIALALDLSLRDHSSGRVTLDDYMRALWREHGAPGGSRPGFVDRPYTLADAEGRLAEASGDPGFARDFFARYVHGREAPDYAALLARAGIMLRRTEEGRAWLGEVRLDDRNGVRVSSPPHIGSPLYAAGIDMDDVIRELDNQAITSFAEVTRVLARHKPGDRVGVVFVNRTGVPQRGSITLGDDPAFEIVPAESAGTLTPAQRAFRESWIN